MCNTLYLFLCILSFSVKSGIKQKGNFPKAINQVTIFGERAEQKINANLYWAVVKTKLDNDRYEVKCIDGRKHKTGRANLCHQIFHTVAFGGISNDKKHDMHQVKHFNKEEIKYLEKYLKSNLKNNIQNNKLQKMFNHSNNASQHFKSTGNLEFSVDL